ncbi:MAG: 2-phosphosulfolactate phosphatase, partial [Calditrichota bacterium]
MDSNNNNSSQEHRIDMFFTPAAVTHERLKGYNVVVIDVLRAATTIATALNNGARDVIPAESISRAIDLSIELKREDVLLCGEREGRLVDGFSLGNSPADYSRERVRARTLIFGSTNGSPAIVRAAVARKVLLCAFINLNAVVS